MARRTNRLNNNQVTNITEENPNPKGFSFNYSENFNHVTELTTENFLNWKTNILIAGKENEITSKNQLKRYSTSKILEMSNSLLESNLKRSKMVIFFINQGM